jgi:proteasome lid subunit RPN8/RPN11
MPGLRRRIRGRDLMRWTEQPARLPVQSLAVLAAREPRIAEALATIPAAAGLVVSFASAAIETALRQLAASSREQGGLLLGEVFADGGDPVDARAVCVTQAVPAQDFASSAVALRIESGIWDRARARLEPQELVVGWYHSHPGLGAFFSDTDRRTQAAFFRQLYSVGWVVDPERGESAVFVGRDSLPPARVFYGEPGVSGAPGMSEFGTTSMRSTK